jgi:pimeloyl-ACP methyl ester carboxylesterase
MRALWMLSASCLVAGCHSVNDADARSNRTGVTVGGPLTALNGPVEVVSVAVANDLPVFFLRGREGTHGHFVFLHGRCSHAQGYVQAFQFAVAARGSLVAPQGDAACGGPFRSWTLDADKQHNRIAAAFRAAGDDAPLGEVTLIGYSQGEYLAEMLIERFPERYTRAVLMGAPHTPAVGRLHKLRSAVMVSGELDNKELMKEGARRLDAVGVPTTYVEMPGAPHGAIIDGERTMEAALAWLDTHDRH